MPRALLSVTDKTGLAEFAQGLAALGFELVSTGGTARMLREHGLAVIDAGQITGFGEMLDGRVKTLHPAIHGGLLGVVDNASHLRQMDEAGIVPISLAVVNLYAFEDTVAKEHTWDEAVESIDIGGPAMTRAAAKNHASVTVVVDPADYPGVLAELQAGGTSSETRRRLAAKAFSHTACYDAAISSYMLRAVGDELPARLAIGMERKLGLRYGENPHQKAALYADRASQFGIAKAEQLHGKELSYNNILDADAAWELACDMKAGSVAIIKHGNPCGAASGRDLGESYRLARAADPISAFGGIAACHGVLDGKAAAALTEKGNFLEVVIAEDFTEEALEAFESRAGWGVNVRLLRARLSPSAPTRTIRSVRGGWLVQDSDEDPGNTWRTAGQITPDEDQLEALRFAWTIIPHVKSNAILVAAKGELLGTGAGQMNRVESVRLALKQAGERAEGAVLASDAFFPFPDSVEEAAKAGIAAVIQPGGSKKDDEVVAAADRLGIAMVLTGTRHFRH